MRNFLLLLCIVFTQKIFAQVPMAMPPEADAFYKNAMPVIKPQIKDLIIKSAAALKNQRANADSLMKALQSNPKLKGMSEANIAAISTLIMVQASNDADEELKKMVLSMRGNGNDAEPVSNTGDKNQLGQQINDRKQLMLQMIMARKSKMAEEISLVFKKVPNNRDNIINNLK